MLIYESLLEVISYECAKQSFAVLASESPNWVERLATSLTPIPHTKEYLIV